MISCRHHSLMVKDEKFTSWRLDAVDNAGVQVLEDVNVITLHTLKIN